MKHVGLLSDFMYSCNNKNVVLKFCVIFTCIVVMSAMTFSASIAKAETETPHKEAVPVAENPEIEKRMLELTENLRCLVCQNETIADSRADFSNDMRRIIREQIKADKTDEEIIDFLVDRYGDFVLYNPPMKNTTLFLWFGPLIFFIVSTIFLIKYLKGRQLQIEEANLTVDEQKKVSALLDGEEETSVSAEQNERRDASDDLNNDLTEEKMQQVDVPENDDKGKNV